MTQPMNHLIAPTQRSNIKGTHTVNKFYCRFVIVVLLTYYTSLLVRKNSRCELFHDRVVQLQVGHNCRHSFSKRFNPVGVPKCTQTHDHPLMPTISTLLMVCRQEVTTRTLLHYKQVQEAT
jgi:hypothetical protein